jgi:hypothetical protein
MRKRGYTHDPIMAIWSFKRKRNQLGEIIKYKARLCCHGGQTVKGRYFHKTIAKTTISGTAVVVMRLVNIRLI